MREETGLLVVAVRVLGVFGGPEFRVTYRNGDHVEYVMSVFECRVVGGEMSADGVETLGARYFSREELGELELAEWGEDRSPAGACARSTGGALPAASPSAPDSVAQVGWVSANARGDAFADCDPGRWPA